MTGEEWRPTRTTDRRDRRHLPGPVETVPGTVPPVKIPTPCM